MSGCGSAVARKIWKKIVEDQYSQKPWQDARNFSKVSIHFNKIPNS